ncbi:MAG: peroxiredoxin [Acidobacteria bacterium]|nr:peroxiredoxin [Acidobacteriota bacterium]
MERTIVMMTMLLGFLGSGTASDLKPGDAAPGLKLKTDEGANFDLQSRKGQWTVLYFYPKADTPGCTKQACAFRDNIMEIRKLGADIFGVSADGVDALKKFKKNHNLNFTLLADPELNAIKAYGAKMPVMNMSKRWTFIIGPDLRIRSIEKDVDPVLDAKRVAEKIRDMQSGPR